MKQLIIATILAMSFTTIALSQNAANVQSDQPTKVEVIAEINPPYPDMSGVAVTSDNRVFLTFPRHADNHKEFALAELTDGNLIPFPNKEFVYPSAKPFNEWLVSPHGAYMDANDVLWVIDDGKRAGVNGIPEGAAKVVAIDVKTKKVLHSLPIPKPILTDKSHYNDLRVDLSHGAKGTVYITNSGFGQYFSLVVVDVATGKTKEVLLNDPTTSPDLGFMAFLEGQPHVYDFNHQTFPNGGADGIAISPDNNTLYWTNISGRQFHSIPTAILSDFNATPEQVKAAVKFEGENPACDGLAEDEQGNIYFGSFEQQSLVKRDSTGNYQLIAHDPVNFVWPDGLAYRNGYLYVTLGQWNRLPGFNGGKDLRKPPFLVVKMKVN